MRGFRTELHTLRTDGRAVSALETLELAYSSLEVVEHEHPHGSAGVTVLTGR